MQDIPMPTMDWDREYVSRYLLFKAKKEMFASCHHSKKIWHEWSRVLAKIVRFFATEIFLFAKYMDSQSNSI